LELGKQTIAVVEDDPHLRRGIVRLLAAQGFGTRAFDSAESFLDDETAKEAACLVLDIELGGISGIELRRRLTKSGSPMPVIFITGTSDASIKDDAIASGCVDYLSKPFAVSHLMAAIATAIA
jgi:FixJ family two-component response regulator